VTGAALAGLSLLAGVAALDASAAFQVMIGQPVVCGWAAGLIAGQPALGLASGVLLQLLWSRLNPVGATAYPDVGPATVAGVTVASRLASGGPRWTPAPGDLLPPAELVPSLLAGLLVALLAGMLGSALTVRERRGNARLAAVADRAARAGSFAGVERANATGAARAFLRGVLVMIPALLLVALIDRTGFEPALAGGAGGLVAFWWLGLGALATVLFRGDRADWALLAVGLALGALVRGVLS